MKLANAVAETLARAGIRHVFCVSGGASLHLIHGVADTEGIDYVCPQHEQAAGFAADAYARFAGIACALATSGPGATNLITAIGSSYYDSIPVIYITGQVATFRMTGDAGVRQIGFQETPIVDIVRPITKYAVTVMRAEDAIPELEKCIRIAREHRQGPAVYDLPDDLQRKDL